MKIGKFMRSPIGIAAVVVGLYCGLQTLNRHSALNRLESPEERVQVLEEQSNSVAIAQPFDTTYKLDGFDSYNEISDLIESIEEEIGIPDDLLHLTVLVESKGKGGDRFEPGFKRKYIENGKFGFAKNRTYQEVFEKVKNTNPSLTMEKFKERLATSVGPAQILYCTAIDLGFRGSLDELRETENNLTYAAKMIGNQSKHTGFDWEKVLTAYNTGSIKGSPTRGHLERGAYFRRLLGKE